MSQQIPAFSSSLLDAAVTNAITQIMNSIPGAGAPLRWHLDLWTPDILATAVTWSPIRGLVSFDHTDSETAAILDGWARLLGLALAAEPPGQAGITKYSGVVDDRPVRLWGVTDHAAWNAEWRQAPSDEVLP